MQALLRRGYARKAAALARPSAVAPVADAEDAVARLASSSLATARSLVCLRDIEWATVVLGFEQANRYTLADGDTGAPAALLAEETASVGSAVARQLLRARRSFVATLLDAGGGVLARVRRPLYAINSKTTIEDAGGDEIGAVIQRWHPLRRKYDLFAHGAQFAEIDAPTLAWEFVVRDEGGRGAALIDRNFVGFGRELFTDAGKYAIHFGDASAAAAVAAASRVVAAAHPALPAAAARALVPAGVAPGAALVPTSTGQVMELASPLTSLPERLAVVAAAIAIDFDYFSRHSSAAGGVAPFFMPLPVPPVPVPDVGGGADAGAAPPPPPPPPPTAADSDPLERDLGGDDGGWFGGDDNDGGGGGDGDDAGWSWDDGGGGDDGGGDDEGGGGGLFGLLRDLAGWPED